MKRRVRAPEDGGEKREIGVKRRAKWRNREWINGGSHGGVDQGKRLQKTLVLTK